MTTRRQLIQAAQDCQHVRSFGFIGSRVRINWVGTSACSGPIFKSVRAALVAIQSATNRTDNHSPESRLNAH